MKKYLIALAALTLLIPSLAYSDVVTFKVGFFFPRADSDLWITEFENMDFTKSNFQSSNFGFTYEYFLSNQLSVMFGVDGYTRQKTGMYRDFVGETIEGFDYAFDYGEGFGIAHVFSVSITPIQASIKLAPLGRRQKIIPFIGGGVGLYLWNVRLQGDVIDFTEAIEFYDPNLDAVVDGYEIFFEDARENNKFKLGYHVFGGVMIPIANRISIEGEIKYNHARAAFSEAFVGFEPFDLSGIQFAVGLNYWF